jgi:hypothetical protein
MLLSACDINRVMAKVMNPAAPAFLEIKQATAITRDWGHAMTASLANDRVATKVIGTMLENISRMVIYAMVLVDRHFSSSAIRFSSSSIFSIMIEVSFNSQKAFAFIIFQAQSLSGGRIVITVRFLP